VTASSGVRCAEHYRTVCVLVSDAQLQPNVPAGPCRSDRFAVTARIELDLRAAAPVGEELVVEAWIAARDGLKAHPRSELRDGERVLAEATAVYVETERPSSLRHDSQTPTTGK